MKKLLLSAACVAMFGVSAPETKAAGFYIQEQSVKGLGTAFAGSTTSIDDASTVYFNPAGMTQLDGAQMNAGAHILLPYADINNNGSVAPPGAPGGVGSNPGNPYDPSPIPNLFAAAPVDIADQTLWLGIGVTAPFGLASDYGSASFLRFDSTTTKLTTINASPSIAYQPVSWMSIGAGLDVQYADAELRNIVFAGVGAEGLSTLEGDDISYGYNVGLQFYPREDTTIGMHYRSAISHTLDGDISVAGTGVIDFSEGGEADLDLPDIATFGISHDVNDKFRVMGQATWFGWNNFESIAPVRDSGTPVTPVIQNYQTTWAFAAGAEYDINEDWTARAGYQYDQTPTTDTFRTSRTPDGDRNWFSAGGTYKINENLDLDFAATYIHVGDGTISVTRNVLADATVSANTEGQVGIVATSINWKF